MTLLEASMANPRRFGSARLRVPLRHSSQKSPESVILGLEVPASPTLLVSPPLLPPPVSQGYAPYNPRKKNQDVLVIEKDEATNSLFLCVMDGHGEQGHLVSQSFKRDIPPALFSHPQWASDPNTSLQEVVLGLEATMNGPSSRIDTQFSGTTSVPVPPPALPASA